jgi:hypothetical protein
MVTIKDLVEDAKIDGDTLEQWVSTLPSHLIFLAQSGNFKAEKATEEYIAEGRILWAKNAT